MKIVELYENMAHLETIIDWNLREWPKPDRNREDVKQRILGSGARNQLPQTLILIEGNRPIGYSTLIFYENGVPKGQLHWIDAVYITPEKRGEGLGSNLVRASEDKAAQLSIPRLFALTDFPGFYHKLGWTTVESSSNGIVVSKKIAKMRT